MGAPLNIEGQKFGQLTAIEIIHIRDDKGKSRRLWKCECECGGEKVCKANELTSGYYTHCGCKWDLLDKKFGSLTVIERIPGEKPKWLCQCDCGNEYTWTTNQLIKKNSHHCGCKKSELARRSAKARSGTFSTKASVNNLINSYRVGAKRRRYTWDLTPERAEELFSSNCYYCNAKPSNVSQGTISSPDFIYNGIDRYDNEKGYIEGNVVPCCTNCNKAKLIMHGDDYIKLAKAIAYNHQ